MPAAGPATAAERITQTELDALDALMVQMRAAVEAQDGPRFSELNHEFHATIVAACGNEMLRELTMDIWQRHSGFQRVFRMVPGRLARSQSEHEGIMAALHARDANRAANEQHDRYAGECELRDTLDFPLSWIHRGCVVPYYFASGSF